MARPTHVLVSYEPSPRGDKAVRRAVETAAATGARLTVATVAVVESEDRGCCDTRSVYWNGVVREHAADDLVRARDVIGRRTAAEFRVISGRSVPSALAHEAERCGADLVVVPARRSLVPWARTRRARQVERRTKGVVVVAPE